jgi:hypothetical protein
LLVAGLLVALLELPMAYKIELELLAWLFLWRWAEFCILVGVLRYVDSLFMRYYEKMLTIDPLPKIFKLKKKNFATFYQNLILC